MAATVQVLKDRTMKASDVAALVNANVKALVDGGTIAGSPVHYAKSEQTVALADATDLASAVALTNHMRDVLYGDSSNEILGHNNDDLVHKGKDTVNTVTAPKAATDGTGLVAACTLVDEIVTDYSAHRSQANVHANNDGGNAVTALTAFGRATVLFDTKANHGAADTIIVDDGNGHVVTFEIDKAGDGVAGGNVAVDVSGDTTAAQVAARFKTALDAQLVGGGGTLQLTDGISTATITVTSTVRGKSPVITKGSGPDTLGQTTATAALVARANDAKAQINAHLGAGSTQGMLRVVAF